MLLDINIIIIKYLKNCGLIFELIVFYIFNFY